MVECYAPPPLPHLIGQIIGALHLQRSFNLTIRWPPEAVIDKAKATVLRAEPNGPLSYVKSTHDLAPGVYNLDGFRQSWLYFDAPPQTSLPPPPPPPPSSSSSPSTSEVVATASVAASPTQVMSRFGSIKDAWSSAKAALSPGASDSSGRSETEVASPGPGRVMGSAAHRLRTTYLAPLPPVREQITEMLRAAVALRLDADQERDLELQASPSSAPPGPTGQIAKPTKPRATQSRPSEVVTERTSLEEVRMRSPLSPLDPGTRHTNAALLLT